MRKTLTTLVALAAFGIAAPALAEEGMAKPAAAPAAKAEPSATAKKKHKNVAKKTETKPAAKAEGTTAK